MTTSHTVLSNAFELEAKNKEGQTLFLSCIAISIHSVQSKRLAYVKTPSLNLIILEACKYLCMRSGMSHMEVGGSAGPIQCIVNDSIIML